MRRYIAEKVSQQFNRGPLPIVMACLDPLLTHRRLLELQIVSAFHHSI